ncbi:MAG: Uma2 family endonuclease [Nostoc sp. GBBB01]|jgi:Uma2 family endonuclease|uniref:Uma2 family endonuclease n=1 Tax=Nostoc punctiforme FACHB-252 TaxID=1357509 RepID=A0ABR8HD18_NOSPU|nr:Uma2 family endonuclease [Nostoc punctiforme]MBD2613698.1 Uma2 family endonuclease [Nostoc punctiforme FACHB-252]MBL1202802.1 Uma2 family endonuclease [Nostoc sp. GBBB01]
MTITQELESQPDISKDVIFPSSDLWSDEPPLESDLHLRQIILLLQSLEWLWQDRNDFYAAGNLTIYYSPHQKKSEYFRGPDLFVVLGTERKARKSWVVWEEYGKYPNVILEILSESTVKTDKGLKKEIYQDTFRTPNYFWFDPYTLEFAGFNLVDAKYQPLQANEQGYLWSEQLGLYLGIHQQLLRLFTADGQLVPIPEEAAAQAQEKVERLAAKLRELNIDPDTI